MKGFRAESRNLEQMEALLARLDEVHRTAVCKLFHQLTVPPDLCYLRDGLKRTCAILQRYGEELDDVLSRIKEPALRSAEMLATAKFLLDDHELWNVGPHDPLLAEMSGTANPEDHPLHGFCFSVCPYWVTLFFATRNDGNPASLGVACAFDALVAEVAMHIIAVNSQGSSDRYREYCRKWTENQEQPASPWMSGPARTSTVIAARVLGRLARADWVEVLIEFVGGGPALRLSRRVQTAEGLWTRKRYDKERLEQRSWVLDGLMTLLAASGGSSQPRGARGGGGSGHPQRGPNGYVRLPSSHLLRDEQISFDELTLTIDVLQPTSSEPVDGLTPEDDGPDGDPSSSSTFPMVSIPSGNSSPAASGRLLASQASSLLRKLLGAPNTNFRNLSSPQIRRLSLALTNPDPDALSWQLEASVKTMLATGRDLRSAKAWVQPDLQSASRASDDGDVHFAFAEGVWLFHLPPPAFETLEVTPWERKHHSELVLPDHLDMAATLRRAFQALPHPHSLSISPSDEHCIKQWLRAITADTRPSMRSLSSFLFARLIQGSGGDLGIATLLTGQSLAHAKTTSHYSSYAIADVASAYQQALAPIRTAPGNYDSEPGFVGARRIPTPEAVSGLLHDLRTLIHSLTEPTDAPLRANAFTAYTMAGLHLATAARPAVERVLYDGSDELGFVLLTEKARTPYDYRPVGLPPILHKQLTGYRIFLRRHIPAWQPDEGLFFQFGPDGKPCGAFTPQSFRDLARGLGCDMELYAYRRFERTGLVTRKPADADYFEAEDIDALLGHWYERVSPHDPLSTYPPRRLRELADGPIEDLLKSVGYIVVAPP